MVSTLAGRRMLRLVFSLLVAACCYGVAPGKAAAAGVCPDNGAALPAACTKEIRIHNNTEGPLWAVVQGTIQLTDALNCTKAGKGGGDVWLQAALGNTSDCLAVTHDYYIFINPGVGIPKGGFVSIQVPWWSKRAGATNDKYVDWWRGGRVILFDDKTAFMEAYNQQAAHPQVLFAAGTQKPECTTGMANNACATIRILQVQPGTAIDPHLPYQLNEYTFADVAKVTDNGTKGGNFIDFNQGYNVSNVDQVYLPLAIEPVRKPANVGYMGTTMSVDVFRTQLGNFAKAGANWPIYNNPVVGSAKMYPNAGIRVPAGQTIFAYYMDPGKFPDGKTPVIIPAAPKLMQGMINQWKTCTAATPQNCPQSAFYKAINSVFLDNYKSYVSTCTQIPDWLKPATQNPAKPKDTAYLFFIYGWVPFNVACGNKELPVVDDLPPAGHAILDYFEMQYNYQGNAANPAQWFNPYTHLIHADLTDGGLDASAYAFSIDDHASFLSNSGVSVPGGLIFAVGGGKGLEAGFPHAPPVPAFYKWYDFAIGLGAPAAGATYWTKYGICSQTADTPFPTESKVGWVMGVDPALTPINFQKPCPVTLQDSAGRKYQFVILRAKAPGTTLPQTAIWPAFEPKAPNNFDPNIVSCPTKTGFVAPKDWCMQLNQVSRPSSVQTAPGFYSIGAPPPLK
jgi:hypothetical protein